MCPLGLSLVLLSPMKNQGTGVNGVTQVLTPSLSVRTSVTSRYEMLYRSATAQEEAALDAATARGTRMRGWGGRGNNLLLQRLWDGDWSGIPNPCNASIFPRG